MVVEYKVEGGWKEDGGRRMESGDNGSEWECAGHDANQGLPMRNDGTLNSICRQGFVPGFTTHLLRAAGSDAPQSHQEDYTLDVRAPGKCRLVLEHVARLTPHSYKGYGHLLVGGIWSLPIVARFSPISGYSLWYSATTVGP